MAKYNDFNTTILTPRDIPKNLTQFSLSWYLHSGINDYFDSKPTDEKYCILLFDYVEQLESFAQIGYELSNFKFFIHKNQK